MYNVHPSYGQGGPEKHIVHVPFDGDNSGSSTSAKAKVFHLQMLGDNRKFRIRNNSANANIYPVFNLRCLHAAPWDGTIYKSNQWFSKTSSITQVNVNNNSVKWPRK